MKSCPNYFLVVTCSTFPANIHEGMTKTTISKTLIDVSLQPLIFLSLLLYVGCNKVFRVQIWFQREKYDLKDKLSAKQIPLFYLQKKDGFKPSFLQHPCYFVLVSLMQFLKIKIRNCQNS